MKKLMIIVVVFMMFHTSNYAQSYTSLKNKFSVGWEVAFPTSDFVSKTSFAGGRMEYRYMIKPNLSIGIAGSWNSFEEYVPKTTYQKPDGGGAITSDIVKSAYTVPLTVSAHYYFKGSTKILPYAGLGLGTQYSDQTIYFNIYGIEDKNWGFVARPEVGVIYPFKPQTALYFSCAYNYATNQSDELRVDNLSHLALSVGFVLSSR